MNNHPLVLLNCLEQQLVQEIIRLEQTGLEDLNTEKVKLRVYQQLVQIATGR